MKTNSRQGFRACFSAYGEHHDIVLPESDPSFDDGVPSNSQWFETKPEAEAFLMEMKEAK